MYFWIVRMVRVYLMVKIKEKYLNLSRRGDIGEILILKLQKNI